MPTNEPSAMGLALKSALSKVAPTESSSSQPEKVVAAQADTTGIKPTPSDAAEGTTAKDPGTSSSAKFATAPAKKAATVVKKAAAPAKAPAAPKELDPGKVIAAAASGRAPVVVSQTERLQKSLPPHLVLGELPDEGEGPAKVTLEVWGSGCLACRALVENDPDLEPMEELPKCHFSRGQQGCPAKHVQISIVGPRRRMVQQMKDAREENDALRFTRLASKLATEPLEFQEAVLRELGLLSGV